MLAAYGTCTGVKSYAQCLTEAFQLLAQRECRAYRDPLGIAGNVAAVSTETQREAAQAAVIYARDHAKSALDAEAAYGQTSEACRQWSIVFNGAFPY